jgi:4'-phosphopantetheinyl transferase
MPFLLDINIHSGIRAGVWHITETADELLEHVPLSGEETQQVTAYRHDLRKKQWLACRALLKHLLDPLPAALFYTPDGKPCLKSGSHHISVSHAGHFAAVVCSNLAPVGIDIEKVSERFEKVRERFLTETELSSLPASGRPEHLCILWGGKEAVFKLHGRHDVDFRNDIFIHPFDYICNTNRVCRAILKADGKSTELTLAYQKVEEFMMVVAY